MQLGHSPSRPQPAMSTWAGTVMQRVCPRVLCFSLHLLLIVLLTCLVIIAGHHYEHALNRPFTPAGQTFMSATVTTVTQTFSIVGSRL